MFTGLQFREFNSDSEVNTWSNKNYSRFITETQEMIDQEGRSYASIIYEYGGGAYKLYNDILRVTDGQSEHIRKNSSKYKESFEDIDVLKNTIKKYPLDESIIVYRYRKFSLKDFLHHLMISPNSETLERGFMSTTLLPYSEGIKSLIKSQRYNVLFKISVPKGIPAIPLVFNEKQTLLKEYEMLFMPATRLKLVKKSFDRKIVMPLYEFTII